jgi:DNA adenine methylase
MIDPNFPYFAGKRQTPIDPIFPYFGGKRRAASQVWTALGTVDRYIEPFFGSGAVLLGAPVRPKSELVNDLSHHVANLWRALQSDPEQVWRVASAPCSEVELRARASWLKTWQPPDFSDLSSCDPYAAGVWLWMSCVVIKIGCLDLHRADHGKGIKALEFSRLLFDSVCDRIVRVQVLCGDWSRCLTTSTLCIRPTMGVHSVGIFLDPPYGEGNGIEYENGTGTVARDVWDWAVLNGDNPRLRIVVAGYEDGRTLPSGWTTIERRENGGYGNGNDNRFRERLWCSPHCHRPETISLFGGP